MGDRANVAILQHDGHPVPEGQELPAIFLYTHWGGDELAKTLQDALIRGKERWSDEPYLARIIFSEMTKGSEADLTGYGISTSLCDNEHALLYVDCHTQTVRIEDRVWSFEKYVASDEALRFYRSSGYVGAS